jgi:hypothetical protein
MSQHPGAPGNSKDKESQQLPPDGVAVANLLRSMGVEDYDPLVIKQLLDFTYRYVTDVLQDAEGYHAHVTKQHGVVEMDDVMLAITTRAAHSFIQPPGTDMLNEIADTINKLDLPKPPAVQYGPPLPPDEDMLVAHNFQLQHAYEENDGMDTS